VLAQVQKKYREDADCRKERTDLENEANAFPICQRSKQCRAVARLVGHSTGGAVTQTLALDAADRKPLTLLRSCRAFFAAIT
jgi:pimeloyl-ACP methyl ester carboxylesterase